MKQSILYIILSIFLLVSAFYALNSQSEQRRLAELEGVEIPDYKNISYRIEGVDVMLDNGFSEIRPATSSSSKIVTRYFGNEIKKDLNEDKLEDVVFLLTQDGGGSGTFYYVVAALKIDEGYVGSEAFFLGDRILPQEIKSESDNTIVISFLDRDEEESFAEEPTALRRIELFLEKDSLKFKEVIVEEKTEEESLE